jgi:hypothetical protein
VAQIVGNLTRRFAELDVFPASGGACLEVGAGLAWASRACKQHDPRILTVVQNVSGECAKLCPWVDRYHVGTVDSLPAGERYQLISLTHVIEHLLEPRRMLATLAGKLAPGGYL